MILRTTVIKISSFFILFKMRVYGRVYEKMKVFFVTRRAVYMYLCNFMCDLN